MTDEHNSEHFSQRTSKVGRVIEKYELSGLGDELVELWTQDRRSLRNLADYLNQELLRGAMDEAGIDRLDGEVENRYQHLTSDNVSAGVRVESENALKREGVNLEQLRSDFVSHQAVHTYLTKYRDASLPSRSDEDRVAEVSESIRRLESRLQAVTESNLKSLRNTDRISVNDFSVYVDVQVYCEDCNQQYDVSELLHTGTCQCSS